MGDDRVEEGNLDTGMRTSGAPTERAMTIAVLLIALGLLMVLAGGPDELLRALDQTLHSIGGVLFDAYQNLRA
jgi:hypothetical protein